MLSPRFVEAAIRKAIRHHTEAPDTLARQRQGIEKELRRLEGELSRVTDTLARGEALPSILEALRAREDRRHDLQAQLEHLDGLTRTAVRLDTGQFADELRA